MMRGSLIRVIVVWVVSGGTGAGICAEGESLRGRVGVVLEGVEEYELAPHGEGNVYAPHVMIENGLYRMWYGAQGRDGHDRICYAESRDGLEWTKKGIAIDCGTSNHVNDPSVVKVRETYSLYFTRAERDIVDRIDVATSKDGIAWELQGVVVSPGAAGEWDSLVAGRPAVLFEEGVFKMWYDGRKDLPLGSPAKGVPLSASSTRSVGYATSKDGLTWTKHAANPVFGHDAGGVDVSRRRDSQGKEELLMLFESHEGTRMATSADGIAWEERGLYVRKSGEEVDAEGHVTPFLLRAAGGGKPRLYAGVSRDASWNRLRIGVVGD